MTTLNLSMFICPSYFLSLAFMKVGIKVKFIFIHFVILVLMYFVFMLLVKNCVSNMKIVVKRLFSSEQKVDLNYK